LKNMAAPTVTLVDFRSEADETLSAGLPEEDMAGKQDGAICNRDVGVPEEDEMGKQHCAGCNRVYGVSEEVVVRKQESAVWTHIRCPQECQPCGLVDENGGTPPESLEIRAATVLTLAGGVQEKDAVVKLVDVGCNRDIGAPEEDVH